MRANRVFSILTNPWVSCALLATVVLCIYSNVYQGPFVFDGKIQIEENAKIRNLDNYLSFRGFFSHRPLTSFSFALNYRADGLNPFGYHLTNNLIHVLNAILAYFLALEIFAGLSLLPGSFFGRFFRGAGAVDAANEISKFKQQPDNMTLRGMALLTALVFAVHPIQTQAVSYMGQRYTSMAAMFYLASVLLFIWARKWQVQKRGTERLTTQNFVPENTQEKVRHIRVRVFFLYFFSLVFGFLALFCKENAATLFGAILLVEYFLFDRTWRGWKRKLIWVVPLTLVIAFLILYFFASTRGLRFSNLLEDVSVLTRETRSIGRWEYLCTQFNVLVLYVRLLFFPLGQNADYMYPFRQSFFDGLTPLAFLFVLSLIIMAFWNVRKRSALSFGIFWFFITLSIESSIFTISDAMFEHRLYLPLLGFAIAVVYMIFDLSSEYKKWGVVFLIVSVVILGTAAYMRNRIWLHPMTLWQDVAAKSPNNYRAHYNLGNALQREGKLSDAITHYEAALRIAPGFGAAHDNLGLALMDMGRNADAMKHFREAVRLNGRSANARNNLGQALLAQGRVEEATRHLKKAVALDSRYPKANNNLGIALAQQGDLEGAVKYLSKAAKLAPENSEIQNNLGQALMLTNDFEGARKCFLKAVDLTPDFVQARTNLGFAFLRTGKIFEATEQFKEALKLEPSFSPARKGLRQAFQKQRGLGPLRKR